MKIGIAQLLFTVGNIEENYNKIKNAVLEFKTENAELVIFPQMTLMGFPAYDLMQYGEMLDLQDRYVDQIAKLFPSTHILLGGIERNNEKVYNVIYHLWNGRIKNTFIKENLIKEDWLNEAKYFDRKKLQDNVLIIDDKKIVINFEDEVSDKSFQSDLLLYFTAIPTHDYFDKRTEINKNLSKIEKQTIVLNILGSEGHITFPGGSWIKDEEVGLVEQFPFYKEKLQVFATEEFHIIETDKPGKDLDYIYRSIIFGIREYFEQSNFKKAIVGLSGGIDSAVVASLAVEALGKDNVHGVLMPSQFSSDHSVNDAKQLANNLGIEYDIIPIEPMYNQYLESLKPVFGNKPFDVTEENIQARIRGNIVMAIANKFESIVLNTSNKSEALVGYGTLYGDIVGSLGVILDLYKTEVYQLAEYINRKKEIIPENIITKEPSAELHHGQKDSDALPDYTTLDKILKLFIEEKRSHEEVLDMGFDESTLNRVIKLVLKNDYKKYQCPPPLVVSGKNKIFPLLFKKD